MLTNTKPALPNISYGRIIFMQIANDIRYVGVNDHQIDLFEGQYGSLTVEH